MTVEEPGGLDRSDDVVDRHQRLGSQPEVACALILQPPHARPWRARQGRHLTQHWQAVPAGWMAVQPPGQLGPARPPPGAVKIIPGVLVNQSGAHGKDLAATQPGEHRRGQVQRSPKTVGNNGVFGGCWCMGFHPEDSRTDAAQPCREEQRVREGQARAALVPRALAAGPPASNHLQPGRFADHPPR
jgi:hypothetical protein